MPLITSQQLKQLSVKQLPEVCEEIREKLIFDVTASGGHLASNLGAVELSVALHFVFGEKDKIVWDVGHQCYTHKILTGRTDFTTLRKQGGLSGFPDVVEDPSDNFTVGHAGTAISQALGLAKARDINGEDYSVVAVVGDGSLTSGLTYEALNNVKDTRLIVVVNDNNMSISQSVGTSTLNLSKLRVGKYDKNKQKLKNGLCRIPLVGKPMYRFLRWCKRRAKLGYYRNSYFDNFDVKYVGIIDGNEVADLVYYLTKIRDNVTKPTVLHIITKKGKGYAPAEENPSLYHAVAPFDTEKGIVPSDKKTFSSEFGNILCDLAKRDPAICAVTAAMCDGTGLCGFSKGFPERFFDVGIAEEHAVTFCAGLAAAGKIPVFAVYSSFLQRCFDQLIHDIAIQNLHVVICVDRAGFVGGDGVTHQGLFDVGMALSVPNTKVWSPDGFDELRKCLEEAVLSDGLCIVRYPKGGETDYDRAAFEEYDGFSVFDAKEKPEATVVTYGRITENAAAAAEKLGNVRVVKLLRLSPINTEKLGSFLVGKVFFAEEGMKNGGVGEFLSETFPEKNIYVRAVSDFTDGGSENELIREYGFDADFLEKMISESLGRV